MNCTIWRTKENRWMLVGASMAEAGYISISGLWGVITRSKESIPPVLEDESSGRYFYMKEKGKNWPFFTAMCPELKKFQFWDENRARHGTYRQEWYLFSQGLLYSPFTEQIEALQRAGLKEVDPLDKDDIAIFPPDYRGKTYLYGTLVLSLPMPKHLQWDFKELCDNENKHE